MKIIKFDEFNAIKVNESLPQQHTVDQMKMVMNMSRKTDIGLRITNLEDEGANIQFYRNAIDNGVESFQDYDKVTKWKDYAEVNKIAGTPQNKSKKVKYTVKNK